MPTLQPIITLNEEIQDVSCFVDGAGVVFIATARTTGQAIHVYKVVGTTVTALADATPPANCGQYSVSLQGSGTNLVLTATGHFFDSTAPRRNVISQAVYPGVVTRAAADPYHAAGAFEVTVTPPPAPAPVGPSAAEIADAVRTRFLADLGSDSLRHGFGGLIQSASEAAVVDCLRSTGAGETSNENRDRVFQGLTNLVYGVLKSNGLIK